MACFTTRERETRFLVATCGEETRQTPRGKIEKGGKKKTSKKGEKRETGNC